MYPVCYQEEVEQDLTAHEGFLSLIVKPGRDPL